MVIHWLNVVALPVGFGYGEFIHRSTTVFEPAQTPARPVSEVSLKVRRPSRMSDPLRCPDPSQRFYQLSGYKLFTTI